MIQRSDLPFIWYGILLYATGLIYFIIRVRMTHTKEVHMETEKYPYHHFYMLGYLIVLPFSTVLCIWLLPKWVTTSHPFDPLLIMVPMLWPAQLGGFLLEKLKAKKLRAKTLKDKKRDVIVYIIWSAMLVYALIRYLVYYL